MTPQLFLQSWAEHTSQSFRCVPQIVEEQAAQAVRYGLTCDDIRLVMAYLRREIAKDRSGFNPQSLTWRVNAADGWLKFQERLMLAQEAVKRGWRPFPAQRSAPANVVPMAVPEEDAALRAKMVEGLKQLRGA